MLATYVNKIKEDAEPTNAAVAPSPIQAAGPTTETLRTCGTIVAILPLDEGEDFTIPIVNAQGSTSDASRTSLKRSAPSHEEPRAKRLRQSDEQAVASTSKNSPPHATPSRRPSRPRKSSGLFRYIAQSIFRSSWSNPTFTSGSSSTSPNPWQIPAEALHTPEKPVIPSPVTNGLALKRQDSFIAVDRGDHEEWLSPRLARLEPENIVRIGSFPLYYPPGWPHSSGRVSGSASTSGTPTITPRRGGPGARVMDDRNGVERDVLEETPQAGSSVTQAAAAGLDNAGASDSNGSFALPDNAKGKKRARDSEDEASDRYRQRSRSAESMPSQSSLCLPSADGEGALTLLANIESESRVNDCQGLSPRPLQGSHGAHSKMAPASRPRRSTRSPAGPSIQVNQASTLRHSPRKPLSK
ncbi:hypothetical protein GALMADRAFT_221825 [Galerina marginata CBS 339.88]|uniref:Uncharacterized protein n=1 Tax=Galerina marginata (strain CBS 339.88) TaxID=685588 RepID=A0A067TI11_GALM3|nr:hypothetical protein GALMADRAFT_221825 [Galerina marginata CBS 339.88]